MKCSSMVDLLKLRTLALALYISFMGQFGLAFKNPTGICVKFMNAVFTALDESPVQRDVYLREEDSGKLPLKFLNTCWIEG